MKYWVVAAVALVGVVAGADRARQPIRAPQYEGKTFEQWRDGLNEEISPKKRIEAIRALTAFGVRGRADDCTRALLKLTEEYLVVDKKGNLGEDAEVVEELLKAFERLGEQSAPVVRVVLRNPKSPLRRAAVWAAHRAKSWQLRKQVKQELAAVFADEGGELQDEARWALWETLERDQAGLGEEQLAVLRATYHRNADVRAAAIKLLVYEGGRVDLIVPRLAVLLREYDDVETVSAALWAVSKLGPKAEGARASLLLLLERKIVAKGSWDLLDDVTGALRGLAKADRKAAALVRRALGRLEWESRPQTVLSIENGQVRTIHFGRHDETIKRLSALNEMLSE